MKNYKILENRPELTSEQIMKGMDFAKIKTSAAIAKASLLKALIIQSVFGIIVISSCVLIYQNYKFSAHDKKQPIVVDTTKTIVATEKDSIISPKGTVTNKVPITIVESITIVNKSAHLPELPVDTTSKNSNANNNSEKYSDQSPVSNEKTSDDALAKNGEGLKNDAESKSINKLNRLTKCKLWKPKKFCDLPKGVNLSSSYDVDDAEYDYVSCQEATKNMATMKAVWVTIKTSGRSKLQLESQLKNITLVGVNNGKLLHPLMIATVADGSTFFGNKFKAKKFAAIYNGQMDFFLFFSEAEIGDKIIINNFIETIIQE
jgi:hypothetical protein